MREDDTATNIKQANQGDNNNSESFISDQSEDPDIEAKTIQTKKKRRQMKKEFKS